MKIAEIFSSIHGEVNGHHQGRMCTFVRISGCNLVPSCYYCDTAHTQNPNYGTEMSNLQILQEIKEIKNKYVCITGGEPLLNKNDVLELIVMLRSAGFIISIETNGTVDIDPFFHYVDSFVLDYKTGVKNYQPILLNYLHLRKTDVIKFVVDRKSMKEAINIYKSIKDFYSDSKEEPLYAFSPILSEDFNATRLFWVLKHEGITDVIISLQIHKFIDFQ